MLSILGFITGIAPALAQIGLQITDLQKARLSAETDERKAELNQQIEELHDKRQVLVAEAGSRFNAIVRFIGAIGPIAYISKLLLWDKVVGSLYGCYGVAGNSSACGIFNTDPLDPYLWGLVGAIYGFYYVTSKMK